MTPAHSTGDLAELVCSNSLGSTRPDRALGLLKEELKILDCELLKIAQSCSVPAGIGLSVDRERFSSEVTCKIEKHPFIELIRNEVTSIPDELTILASGPLTSDSLAAELKEFCGEDFLYFYDAVAPIVSNDSLDMSRLVRASRYDAGEAGFLNAFMDKEQYRLFYESLVSAEQHPLHDFEKLHFFEGCLPVEEIARRGERSLEFGPLRPTGFRDSSGRRPFAVVQLRPEDAQGSMYNLVGFQTNLRNSEQEKVFRMIPGLERVEFVRHGRMHRNTYIEAPKLIEPTLAFRKRPDLFICGQLSGAEGYLSAIATGLAAGINSSKIAGGAHPLLFPKETMFGSILTYLAGQNPSLLSSSRRFAPTKPIFGLLAPLSPYPRSSQMRRDAYASRSMDTLRVFAQSAFPSFDSD
jgi:methylenetetrahydrofolate--tRNA-(uracil-5-)-methyltransferase